MILAARKTRTRILALAAVLFAAAGFILPEAAYATKIERIVSPGGLELWLVRERSVPVIAMDFTFRGGASEDPADKAGVATMVSALLDEGAGEMDAQAFQRRMQETAVEISFSAGRDFFHGSLRTLAQNRDDAFALLRLALTKPRFDADAIERTRSHRLASLRRETTSPGDIASRRWWAAAFPNHPYGRPAAGTLESVPRIAASDLRDYTRRVFARDTLKIAIVGDIDAEAAARWIDQVFGELPAKADLRPVPDANPQGLGERLVIPLDVPQAVLRFGGVGVSRKDPDFFAAYIVNHILGGGSFSSRLYREVRERRGLAYSVSSSLVWLKHTALFTGGTATGAERASETLGVMEQEIRRLAESGPTEDELAKAKSFLKGSYALGFDSSSKIAGQLVQIQNDELGIDYIDRRAGLIDAVTLADVRRAAKRLLSGNLLFTVVGRPQGLNPNGG